jgi:hypothetical protein
MVMSMQTLLYFQSKQITASFTTINNYNLQVALLSFVVNSLACILLVWYLDQVIPNEFGAKRHPLFCCFTKNFERPNNNKIKDENNSKFGETGDTINNLNTRRVEEVDQTLKKMERNKEMIEIVGLRK